MSWKFGFPLSIQATFKLTYQKHKMSQGTVVVRDTSFSTAILPTPLSNKLRWSNLNVVNYLQPKVSWKEV